MSTSILIPAHNEAAYLPACLDALLSSDCVGGQVQVVVVANGCTDETVTVARGYAASAASKGWTLDVLDLPEGGKLGALRAGETAATGDVLIYLDADTLVSSPLLAQLSQVLGTAEPRYASGQPNVTVGGDGLTRAFTRFWLTMPFITTGVPGFGVFAMNRAGRARWGDWPDIISDDTFARLHFSPDERHRVPGSYDWPMVEGFANLVRVRRRQDAGVAEVAERFPELLANADPDAGGVPLWRRALRDPVGFATYLSVRITGRLPVLRNATRWTRGR